LQWGRFVNLRADLQSALVGAGWEPSRRMQSCPTFKLTQLLRIPIIFDTFIKQPWLHSTAMLRMPRLSEFLDLKELEEL
jgi:hypothetical protein